MANRFNLAVTLNTLFKVLIVVFIFPCYQSLQADMLTLITTPSERQIINSNRYKSDKVENARLGNLPKVEIIKELVKEEVKKSFLISGITVSSDGTHSAWINSQIYEDGEIIEGKIRVKIIAGNDLKVRITTPDGKQHYGAIGETVQVSYLEAPDS